jgi:hypothetical protein
MKKFVLLFSVLYALATHAQQKATLTQSEKTGIIDTIASKLERYYVFPDTAKKMALYLKKRSKEQAYKNIADYSMFIDSVNKDLQKAHRDLHMRVFYDPSRVADIKQWRSVPQPTAAMLEQQREEDSRTNYGFVKVERLPGNIGYVDFRQFFAVNEGSKNTVAAAMAFIAHTNAIIIDLRKNGGGEPDMVQYILSYFMDSTPVHYNSLYNRITNKTDDFYSLASVKGTKMPHTDLYVLTSNHTFSGAEEFAYDLKNLKRATIIGETTGGGAHPTDLYLINDNVGMAIPFARAINPFTKTNWEGTGVEPDIKVEAEKALLQAQQLALEKIVLHEDSPIGKAQVERNLTLIKAQLHPVTIEAPVKAAYAGTYGERVITIEGDNLYYQRGNQPKHKLIPITQDLFAVEDLDYFRVQFVRTNEGIAEKLRGLYDNGEHDESMRTSKTF